MITHKSFGALSDGREVTATTIAYENGVSMTVLDYGVTIQAICIPNRDGKPVDVVLGYNDAMGYETGGSYFGATIGRYGNRIGKGKFTLNGKEYTLPLNDGENSLHGGVEGFNAKIWNLDVAEEGKLVYSRLSPDGEEGYPGNLTVRVTLELTEAGKLTLTYDAESDADTVLSLTNHTYFNLNGTGNAMEQVLTLYADQITEGDKGCLPTGNFLDVEGTPFDFRTPKAVGRDIEIPWVQTQFAGGYDHNVVLSDKNDVKMAAKLEGLDTGISMTTETTEPGMQFYSGNFMEPHTGKGGNTVPRRGAVCLETQKYPDSPNHDNFPSSVLKAKTPYQSKTIYTFSV